MSKPLNKPKLSDMDMNYKIAFSTPTGKEVLKDLKSLLRYGQTVYQPGKSNDDNAFHQGRQSVINEIIHILNKEAK